LPENPEQSMYQWKRDATAAVAYLNSAELSGKPVVMICEVQFLLRAYLEARKKMHFLYKVARADSAAHLFQQFAVAEERAEGATLASEELRMVAVTKGDVEKGDELALYWACSDGFVAAVQVALAVEGVDVNKAKENGATPLYATCEGGHVDVVRLLLAREEIQINQAKESGATPLWATCQHGHVDVVRLLLARKEIQINQATKNGATPFLTPLMITCHNGHVDVVRLLLARKEIQINQAIEHGYAPLYVTCAKGYVDVVRLLLAREEIQINQALDNGATPLIVATYLGRFSIVEILLSNNNIDASIIFEEKTAAQYSESNARIPSWSFLDNGINQEGRVQCHQLFSSFTK
jgi:ankyrin repeat protein